MIALTSADNNVFELLQRRSEMDLLTQVRYSEKSGFRRCDGQDLNRLSMRRLSLYFRVVGKLGKRDKV